MTKAVHIIGAGLAGSEAALQLALRKIPVHLHEMRPSIQTAVHASANCAELVCSNSFKSMRFDSAAGMLKEELHCLGSVLYDVALDTAVPAGGALAVDRSLFSEQITSLIQANSYITYQQQEIVDPRVLCTDAQAIVLATGPLTSDALGAWLETNTESDALSFYDAAAPIVMADSLDYSRLFRQSRYENNYLQAKKSVLAPMTQEAHMSNDASDGMQVQDAAAAGEGVLPTLPTESVPRGDYWNAPFNKQEYELFIEELVQAQRTMQRDFESKDLFQACQPIEEIARAGFDAPRFGPLKPVGLMDPRTGKRPWAAVQLRAENKAQTCFNLVGFQTNLTFPEQERVFRMIPGFDHAEFARFGVMHRNTFLDAPRCLNNELCLVPARFSEEKEANVPVYVAGQLSGTEGYCEAIRSGLHVALSIVARLKGIAPLSVPSETVYGALLEYATNPETKNYQPMHVNFGILPPLDPPVRNKRARKEAYAQRGSLALESYSACLRREGLL